MIADETDSLEVKNCLRGSDKPLMYPHVNETGLFRHTPEPDGMRITIKPYINPKTVLFLFNDISSFAFYLKTYLISIKHIIQMN